MAAWVLLVVGCLCAVVGAKCVDRPAGAGLFLFGMIAASCGTVAALLTPEVFV